MLGLHPSMLLLFFPLGFKQVFTSDTLSRAFPNALSSRRHHKPSGYIGSSLSYLQRLLSLSILSHSFRTLRYVPAEKEQRGYSCRGRFTHTGNSKKICLGLAMEVKATWWRWDAALAKEHSASVPEQTTVNKTHFGFSDGQLSMCRFSHCPQIPLLKPVTSAGSLPPYSS